MYSQLSALKDLIIVRLISDITFCDVSKSSSCVFVI